MSDFTRQDIEDIAEKAAEKALVSFMLTLGIDIGSPKGIIDVQNHFRHLRSQYDAFKTMKHYGIRAIVGTFATGMAAYILLLFGWKK